MSENDIYKQQKKPVNPLDGFDPNDAQAIMERIKNIEDQYPKIDPMSGQQVGGLPNNLPFKVEGNVPPEMAALFQKGSRAETQKQTQQAQMAGPRLAYTNNPKLNELLEGMKDIVSQYEEVRLPSLSKFYNNEEAPEGGIVHARPMTGQEEEILGTTRHLKKGNAINMIFKNCVRDNIKPEKWLTIDRTHLLIFLRGISYGPLYQVDIKCPLCGNRFESQIDLDALFVNFCPKDYDQNNLKGTLPTTGYKFSFRLPTVADEVMIGNYRDKRNKDTNDNITDDTFTWRTALLLEEVEGLNEHAALMTLLNRLPISDVAHLRSVMNDIPFGVETKVGQWCTSCNEDFEIELPIEANFFFPQVKKASRTPASK